MNTLRDEITAQLDVMNRNRLLRRHSLLKYVCAVIQFLFAVAAAIYGGMLSVAIASWRDRNGRANAVVVVALLGLFLLSLAGIVIMPRLLTRLLGLVCPCCGKGLAPGKVTEAGSCIFCGYQVFDTMTDRSAG